MGKHRRVIWLLALFCFDSGCASAQFRPARLPWQGTALESSTESMSPEISIGSDVEITLRTGEQVVGVITEIGSDAIVVREASEYGAPPSQIAKSDIVSVRMQYADSSEQALVFVAIGAAVAAVVWFVSTTGKLTAN